MTMPVTAPAATRVGARGMLRRLLRGAWNRAYPRAIALVEAGVVDVSSLVTQRFPSPTSRRRSAARFVEMASRSS